MRTYVLIGNFGVGNLGDEALKEYFLTGFPDVSWKVLSAHPLPGEYHRLPGGIRSFFAFRWIETVRIIRSADAVVFGGGTLFTDIESLRAPFLWWIHAFVARLLGKPRIFAFQGIGPFTTPLGKWLTRSALRDAVHISVRDAHSYDRVKSLNKSTKVIHSFDPVFSLIKNKKTNLRTENILGVIPRINSGAMLKKAVTECSQKHSFDKIVILSLQPNNAEEASYCLTLAKEIGATVFPVRTIDELLRGVVASSYVVTERYHGAIAALALGVPFETVSQQAGDKLATIRSQDPDVLLESIRSASDDIVRVF